MAIVEMMKFTLFTTKSKEDDILFQFHKYGKIQIDKVAIEDECESIHDIFTYNNDSFYIEKVHENISKINFMINLLTPFEKKLSIIEKYKNGKPNLGYLELTKVKDKIQIDKIYDEVKFYDEKIKEISQQISLLKSQNDELNKYIKLDVDEREFKKLKYHDGIIGFLPVKNYSKLIEQLDDKDIIYYLEELGTEKDDKLLFIIINNDFKEIAGQILREGGFNRIINQLNGIPSKLIEDNLSKIETLLQNKMEYNEHLKSLAVNLPVLREAYDYYQNENCREEVKNNLLKSNKFLVIQGWVPEENKEEFNRILTENLGSNYYVEMNKASKDDENVPVLLKNNALNSSFESITQMYAYPRYNEIDPTPLITPFYLVFFGMMMADIGYGLLLLIFSSLALKLFNLEESQKKFMKFFFFLSFPTIVAGFIYGSFFGDALKNVIKLPALLDQSKDLMTILAISIVLGVIQIFVGLGVKAYMYIRDGKFLDAVFDVFTWYFALIGSIGLLLTMMTNYIPKSISPIFTAIMVIGMVGIVLTNGRSNKTFFGKAVGGLYALYGISGYVGDFVSYSRIMALGLAGGYIAFAFNMIIGMMPIWAKFTIGILIFIFAHLFNLFLSALGAYVHTCRLHYVEYFGKFYEGGGKPFAPFKSSNKYIEINDK